MALMAMCSHLGKYINNISTRSVFKESEKKIDKEFLYVPAKDNI